MTCAHPFSRDPLRFQVSSLWGVLTLCLFCGPTLPTSYSQDALPRRTPWLNSKLVDAPDPPLPYVLEQAFPLEFMGPISFHRMPDSSIFLVLEQNGRIFTFDSAQPTPEAHLLVDLNVTPPPHSEVSSEDGNKRNSDRNVQLFSLCFHPDYERNRFIYLCYITVGGGRDTDTHIARFQLLPGARPQFVVDSELEILTCDGGGHNGCTLAFGPDGMLYISLGDLTSPTPPDERDTGQDISDLYASILRINVDEVDDQAYQGGNYAIPSDNPFVDLENARGEVYAYGLRNPFRMSFDPATGELWVGDVGWEAWEMVYRVKPGGNYGWAIKEGPGDVKDQPPGPTPILAADIALNHAEAASVTGGMVYRGDRYQDLRGTYIFGDWITRKYWAASFDEDRITNLREIALSPVKPICFEVDSDGELLVLDYNSGNRAGSIYRFVPNPRAREERQKFPEQLSATGLFEDTWEHSPADGVTGYSLNATMWKDGASVDYLLGLPNNSQAVFHQNPQTTFDWFTTRVVMPVGTVLAKTYSLGQIPEQGRPRRLETQISLKDSQGDWQFFTYRWRDDGSDADLVPADGAVAEFDVELPGEGKTRRTWTFASRTSCRVCHTPWVGETMAFSESQLRSPWLADDSWRQLMRQGFTRCAEGPQPLPDAEFAGMVPPYESSHPLDRRARSYLHVNCAHCHLFGGNASTNFDISFDKPLAESNILDQLPMRGELGIPQGKVAVAGQPGRSLLLYRIAKQGSGRMPHIGSQRTDADAVRLIRQWLAQLPQDQATLIALDQLCAPATSSTTRINRMNAAEQLLQDPVRAVELAAAIAEGRVPQAIVRSIVESSRQFPLSTQELLETFAAPDQQIQRLGANINPSDLLQATGDPARGAELFAQGIGTCSGCHRIHQVGKEIGPDLSLIADKLKSREAILESILHPSRQIEEKYRSVSALTLDGQVVVGTVVEETETELILVDANGVRHELAQDDLEAVKKLETSLMPEQLLAPLTEQQAVDLIDYLSSLKSQPAG